MILIKKRNKTRCYVGKFHSHQQLIRVGKGRHYRTTEYAEYEWQLKHGLMKLKPVRGAKPVFIHLTFNVKGGVEVPTWNLIKEDTGYCYKKYKTKEEAEERQAQLKGYKIEHEPVKILYGTKGDWDNISKPVLDFMEALRIINNDSQVVKPQVDFTFNNKRNSIDIELEELEIVEQEDGIFKFERKKNSK